MTDDFILRVDTSHMESITKTIDEKLRRLENLITRLEKIVERVQPAVNFADCTFEEMQQENRTLQRKISRLEENEK